MNRITDYDYYCAFKVKTEGVNKVSYLRTRHEVLGKNLARVCSQNAKSVTKVYLAALSESNYHLLRKKVAKLINKELSTKLRLSEQKVNRVKIKFIEGTESTSSGTNAVWNDISNCYVRGYFEVTKVTEYGGSPLWRRTQKLKKKIVVVKQKNKWAMFRTLVHELFHWFIFTFVTKEDDNKYDKWIDRKPKKKR